MSGHGQQPWEYHVDSELGPDDLATLGREGWELVGIENGVFYLKRPPLSFREQVTLDQKRRYYAEWNVNAGGAGR